MALCHERKTVMFWIFLALAGLVAFSVTLGQFSVWFGLLKFALFVAVGVIAVMGIALVFRRGKHREIQ
jgi:hypothetical protein